MAVAILEETSPPDRANIWLSAASGILFVVTGALIVGAFYARWGELSAILTFIAGGTLATALDLVGSLGSDHRNGDDRDHREPPIQIDEEQISTVLAEVYEKIAHGRIASAPPKGSELNGSDVEDSEWSPKHFLGTDNALALAYLRLAVEREIRRLAVESGSIPLHRTPISKLVSVLVSREVLPSEIESVIRDVVTICNAAVHGAAISFETANWAVGIGEDLLALLRSLHPESYKPTPAPADGR